MKKREACIYIVVRRASFFHIEARLLYAQIMFKFRIHRYSPRKLIFKREKKIGTKIVMPGMCWRKSSEYVVKIIGLPSM